VPAPDRLQALRELARAEGIAYCEMAAKQGSGLEQLIEWIRVQSRDGTATDDDR